MALSRSDHGSTVSKEGRKLVEGNLVIAVVVVLLFPGFQHLPRYFAPLKFGIPNAHDGFSINRATERDEDLVVLDSTSTSYPNKLGSADLSRTTQLSGSNQRPLAITGLRQVLRDAWAMTHPYWFSEDRWAARGLLIAVIALNLGIVYINVLLNKWNNTFYDALQDKNYTVFLHQLIRFSWLAGLFIVFAVYQFYLNQMLQIRWRRWLTEYYLREWLTKGAYYRMQLVAGQADNPDQRVAEDVPQFIASTLNLGIDGMRAVVTLISFIAILWGLSGTLTIPGSSIRLPGYLVWAALLYALAGTWLTDRIGRPLVRLNFDQQRYEADFRFNLVRFRENAEGVALYHGEADEFRTFRESFSSIIRNWWGIMRQQKRLTWLTAGYGQAA
ncbi:MAG: transporter ATP-binding protein, partial [Candidatus Acidoferrum typicum]|nr:transporter ATP-binding protein [Candidatus Acidoferrum typicum]